MGSPFLFEHRLGARLFRLLQNDKDISRYDYVLIDTPPNIGPMLRNALLISDYVLVPCPVGDQYALDGFSTFIQVLSQAKQQNKKLLLLGVVLTKYDGRAVTHKKNKDRIRAFFDAKGIPVFDTEIRVNIDIDRAHSHRKTIFEFDATKSGAQDYQNLAREGHRPCPKRSLAPRKILLQAFRRRKASTRFPRSRPFRKTPSPF